MSWKQIICTDRYFVRGAVIQVLVLSLIVFEDVESALAFASPYRESLLETVLQLSDEDLNTIEIDRHDVGYVRKAGDFILRIAYHEAVRAGQMLQYLRMADAPRPSIWD
jgi:hypothetical protein